MHYKTFEIYALITKSERYYTFQLAWLNLSFNILWYCCYAKLHLEWSKLIFLIEFVDHILKNVTPCRIVFDWHIHMLCRVDTHWVQEHNVV